MQPGEATYEDSAPLGFMQKRNFSRSDILCKHHLLELSTVLRNDLSWQMAILLV